MTSAGELYISLSISFGASPAAADTASGADRRLEWTLCLLVSPDALWLSGFQEWDAWADAQS